MPAGRPPTPIEEKIRLGNPSKRTLPEPIGYIEGLSEVPETPRELGTIGSKQWPIIWQAAIIWLNPGLDGPVVERVCRLYDEIDELEANVREHGLVLNEPIVTARGPAIDPATGEIMTKRVANPAAKLLRDAEKQLQGWLSDLGFTPSARARLGLVRIKAEGKIADLQSKQQAQQAQSTMER